MIEAQTLPNTNNLFTHTLFKETLCFHCDKHHLENIKKLNNLISSTKYKKEPSENNIQESYKLQKKVIYNDEAQI